MLEGFALAAAWLALGAQASAGSPRDALPDLLVVQVRASEPSAASDPDPRLLPPDRYADGCRIVAYSPSRPGEGPIDLTPGFASALDPDVAFDGGSILFAGKQAPADPWQIWRMRRDGSGKTQLTHGPGGFVSPLHVGTLFYLDDAMPSPQIALVGLERGPEGQPGAAGALYLAGADGQGLRRVSFGLGSDLDPDILPSGRLVYSSWRRRTEAGGLYALMALNIDGTDLAPFHGAQDPPAFKMTPRVSAGDRVYFVEARSAAWLSGGAIAYVSQRRPLHSRTLLAQPPDGSYHSPCPLPSGGLLASYRPDASGATYGIYRVSAETGQRLEPVLADAGWHSLDAHVLGSRPEPHGRASIVDLTKDSAVYYCLDAYRSQVPGDTTRLEPGSIRQVRVIEGTPAAEAAGRAAADTAESGSDAKAPGLQPAFARVLGYAPVEEDGSFHIQVPAQVPLAFQLLDANGRVLRSQQSWIWAMPREARGCIGCHEDWEMAPPNRLATAVTKPAAPLLAPETVEWVDLGAIRDRDAENGAAARGQEE